MYNLCVKVSFNALFIYQLSAILHFIRSNPTVEEQQLQNISRALATDRSLMCDFNNEFG